MPAGDRLRDDTNIGARVRGILVARHALFKTPTCRCAGRQPAASKQRSRFRKIQGIKDLWILKGGLKRPDKQVHADQPKKVA